MMFCASGKLAGRNASTRKPSQAGQNYKYSAKVEEASQHNKENHDSVHRLDCLLNLLLPVVELVLDLLRDLLEQLLREDPQQCPGNVQRGEDVAILICSLCEELRLELVSELEVLVLILTQCLLADDGLHGSCVLPNGIIRIHLIRNVGVVETSHALADSRLHQPAQRWEDIDRRVDLPVVQRPVDKHLALGDVSSQVWNGMCDVIVRHGQDGELCDGTSAAFHTTGTLVDGGQVGVHVPRVTTTAWHLLAGS